MAVTYPYISGQGGLVRAFEQFRKTFPPVIDAALLKRFGIAPANESYIINIFRFLGLIDEDGKKVDDASAIFYHGEEAFQTGMEDLLRNAYADLFSEHGDGAWTASRDTLSTWFRVRDKTSDLIGSRQASTFLTLAALAGHGELPKAAGAPTTKANRTTPSPGKKKSNVATENKPDPASVAQTAQLPSRASTNRTAEPVGLTVRVEVNLPANGTPDVYDAIFASIRKNLIDP